MLFMCSVAILPLDSLRKHAQRCAYIYTHFYVQVGESHTLRETVLMLFLCLMYVLKPSFAWQRACENLLSHTFITHKSVRTHR